jgi:predicted transcriptional regulator of viral defense system
VVCPRFWQALNKYQKLAQIGSFWYFMFMQTVTEKLIQANLSERIITASQLDRILGGSPQRRYGLVNRALKAGELLRLKRGLYVMQNQYRKTSLHPFAAAQALSPGSYVSLESALGFYGWIPEAVFSITSVIPERKTKTYETPYVGHFTFHPLAIRKNCFLELVSREQVNDQTFLLASPLRALIDLVCFRKISWEGIDWLTEGMRIELELLASIRSEDIRTLQSVYQHKRVQVFLQHLKEELRLD